MKGSNKVLGGGGFHHVTIKARNFEKSVAFYKALGFTEYISWGEGDARGALLDPGDGNYLEIFADGNDGASARPVIAHFALRTDNCTAAVEAAKRAGAQVTTPPTEVDIPSKEPLPITYAFIKGPDGEEVEFFELR